MPIGWAEYPVENVRLTDLVLRKDLQPRGAPGRGELRSDGGDRKGNRGVTAAKGKFIPSAVNRYANRFRAGDVPPPILVARYRGKLLLLDGFQRVEAARIVGVQALPAKIAPVIDLKQARWEAVHANLDHGVPLAPKVKKYAFRVYMNAGNYRKADGSLKSYKEIAQDLGGLVSKTSAFRYMTELFPEIADEIAEEHLPITDGGQGGVRDLYTLNLPPILSIHEDLIQGVREAVTTAMDEARNDADFREVLVTTLRDLLAKLERSEASADCAYGKEAA